MRTFVALFGIASAFGLVLGVAYFTIAKEEAAGSTLLGFMTAALAFAAGYAVFAERDAAPSGDRPWAGPSETEGEDLGIFTTRSAWPITSAACAVFVLTGLLWSLPLASVALAALVLCLWRMGAESGRIG